VIDALSFFGHYPFRRLFIEDLDELIKFMSSKGFQEIHVAYLSSLFYRDPLEANRIAREIFDKTLEKTRSVEISLLAGYNPGYLPVNKFFIEKIIDPFYKAYVLAPAYHGFKLSSRETLRFIDYMCGIDKKIVILDLLEDIREMHRAYILRYLIKEDHLYQFLKNLDETCSRKILLSSFRYDLLRKFLDKISEKELFVDVSSDTLYGYQYDRVKELVDSLGEDLVILSTKTPISYPEAAVFRVAYSDISDSAKEKILRRNAIYFYGK
jgi:hypothetical protein